MDERSNRATSATHTSSAHDRSLPEAVRRLDAAADHVDTRFRGSRMAWRSWGAGPPVVLLHGGFGSWTHWIRTVPSIASRYRVIVPDMPGFGDSDLPAGGDLLEGITQALIAGLQAVIGNERDFHLVGFSFGSVVAGQLAAELSVNDAPARVDRLVLVAPAGLGLPISDFAGLARTRPSMTQDEIASVHRHNLSVVMFADPAAIDDTALAIQMANTARARARGRSYSRSDLLAKASSRIGARRMIALWGDRDAYALRDLPAYEAAVAQVRPDILVHRIAEAGHWVQYEAAEDFNSFVAEVLGHPGRT